MSDFEISERKLPASPDFFINPFFLFSFVVNTLKGIKKSGCEHDLKKELRIADLYYNTMTTLV